MTKTIRLVFANTAFQLLGKLITMGSTILITMLIAQVYLKEGYGRFSIMQNLPALFFIIADFGLNAVAVKEITKTKNLEAKIFGTVLIARIVLSGVLMLLAGGAIWFLTPYDYALKVGIILSLALILTQACIATTNIIFQANQRYNLAVVGQLTSAVLTLSLILYLVHVRASVMWLSFSYVLGWLAAFGVNYTLIVSRLKLTPDFNLDRELLKKLVVPALPLGLMFIFSQINFRADVVLISWLPVPNFIKMSTTEAVALYQLPYKVFEVLLVIPTFFMNSVYPVFIASKVESLAKLKRVFISSLGSLIGSSVLSSGVGIVLAPIIVSILGGADFAGSVLVLRLLLLGLPIFFLTQPIAWLIVTLDGQKYLPRVYLVGAIFNVAANIVFIPMYSFYASAVITWLSELVILSLLCFYAKKCWVQTKTK